LSKKFIHHTKCNAKSAVKQLFIEDISNIVVEYVFDPAIPLLCTCLSSICQLDEVRINNFLNILECIRKKENALMEEYRNLGLLKFAQDLAIKDPVWLGEVLECRILKGV
jgi:hypothetical protein